MNLFMYKLIRHFALSVGLLILGFSMSGVAHAQYDNPNSQIRTDKCQPYTIPLDAVPCDAGYTGKKFPMRTKECPSGKITDGLTFDTSNCKPVGKQNVDVNATDCSLTPTVVGCMALPTLSGCPVGKHWTLAGSKIAHCVNNDPVCPWGTSLTHDFMGEPSCIANTCPSNQVLQSDGISCACPASLPVWSGSSCVVPVCNSYISNANAYCPAGQTGYITNQNTYDCNNNLLNTVEIANTCVTPVSCPGPTTQYTACPVGQTGQRVVTTNYTLVNGACSSSVTTDSSGCTTPPAACSPVNSTQFGPCPAGQTGLASRSQTQNCDGTTTYGAWNMSGCTVTCQSSTSTETAACEPGYTGTQSRTVTVNSCTGTSYGAWDRTSCKQDKPPTCANGASNWPDCKIYEYIPGVCSTNSANGFTCEIAMYCSPGFTLLSGGQGNFTGSDTKGSNFYISRFYSGNWENDYFDSISCQK